jgi:hypothetical protein
VAPAHSRTPGRSPSAEQTARSGGDLNLAGREALRALFADAGMPNEHHQPSDKDRRDDDPNGEHYH